MAEELKNKGNEAFKSGRFSEAIDFYTQAIALNPYSAIFYTNRAVALSSQGEYTKSLKDAERAINIDKNWSKGWLRKAEAHEKLGEDVAALEAYSKGMQIDKKEPKFMDGMMRMSAKTMFDSLPKSKNKEDYSAFKESGTGVKKAFELMSSESPKDQLQGVSLLNGEFVGEGKEYVEEIQKNKPELYELVHSLVVLPDLEDKRVKVAMTVVGAAAMMQAKVYRKIHKTTLKSLEYMIHLPNAAAQECVVDAANVCLAYDANSLGPNVIAEQFYQAKFIDPLISMLREDTPPKMDTVYMAVAILGKIAWYKAGCLDIVKLGGVEAMVKVGALKHSGLQDSGNSKNPLDAIFESTGI